MPIKKDIKKSECYKYSFYYLQSYPKTQKELESKLLQKGFSYEEINETIAFLKEQGFVDDQNFADSYIYSNCVRKGKSTRSVMSKLLQKGIDKKTIERVLEKYGSDIEEGADSKIKKDISQYKKRGLEGLEIIQKLLRKGYSIDQIKSSIENKD